MRRDGERIRVTAQLIKVSDGFHMWSQTYDRKLDDTLAIQTEIANTVAGVLKTKLADGPAPGDADPEAYRLTLGARGRLRQLGAENVTEARRMFEQAIKRDPDYADAYAGLAEATMLLAQNYMAMDFDKARQQSEASLQKALALQPRSVAAQIAAGQTYRVVSFRSGDPGSARRAETHLKTALQLDPKNPDALTGYGNLLTSMNRADEAVPVLRRALEVDPLNRVTLLSMAEAQGQIGKIDEAVEAYKGVIALYPDYIDGPEELGAMLVAHGRLDEAEPYLRRAAAAVTDPTARVRLAHLYMNLGMTAEARSALSEISRPPAAVNLARAILLVMDRDFRGLMTFGEERYARDKDPFWSSAIGVGAQQLGDHRTVLEQVRVLSPSLLGPNPEIGGDLNLPLYAANSLNALGLKDQARRILEQMLTATAEKPGEAATPSRHVYRAQTYAQLGDRARAVNELRQAVNKGYRAIYGLDDFIRLDQNALFASLWADPEFRAQIARIDADNARMRAKVTASRHPQPTRT